MTRTKHGGHLIVVPPSNLIYLFMVLNHNTFVLVFSIKHIIIYFIAKWWVIFRTKPYSDIIIWNKKFWINDVDIKAILFPFSSISRREDTSLIITTSVVIVFCTVCLKELEFETFRTTSEIVYMWLLDFQKFS